MPFTIINTNNSGLFTIRNVNSTGQFSAISASVSGAIAGAPWQLLNTIMTYIRPFSASWQNPNFFRYDFDGPTFAASRNQSPYFILDGGLDMFDGGNYTAPWLLAGTNYTAQNTIPIPTPALNYASGSSTLTDTSFYYTSLGYTSSGSYPLTLIGARSGSGPIGFQKAGNIGADGLGSIVTGSIYTGSTVNGFTTYAYFRQTFGQGLDPNICDVYILLGHPNWGSAFGSVVWTANMSTQIQGAALYATGSSVNLLAATFLLSRTGSTPSLPSLQISSSDIQTSVNNFISRIQQSLSY